MEAASACAARGGVASVAQSGASAKCARRTRMNRRAASYATSAVSRGSSPVLGGRDVKSGFGMASSSVSGSRDMRGVAARAVGEPAMSPGLDEVHAVGDPTATERVGVLLLNLGGPETLDDVQPFLFNLFADPDIIRLPGALQLLQEPLAVLLSRSRAPKSREAYESIGGGSPLRRITQEQADALEQSLKARGQNSKVYVGMRYWKPFTEDALEQIKKDKITRLVVLPLYPQFSISTSGSSLRLLEKIFAEDPYLRTMQHTVIPSWYNRPGYVRSMANLIAQELKQKFPSNPAEPKIFFSAHGVPVSYVKEAGDPYKEEMEECVQLIMEDLNRRLGMTNDHVLAYQSRVGPVEWLKPYTDDVIRELGEGGCKSLCAVPISFVSEHIETLEEIDMEYRELAEESGIEGWARVPALNTDTIFIDDLADAVLEALPFVAKLSPAAATTPPPPSGAIAAAAVSAAVPSGRVGDLLAAYDREGLQIPYPERVPVWEWGWTKNAETWNGRLAMLVLAALLVLEIGSGSDSGISGLLNQ